MQIAAFIVFTVKRYDGIPDTVRVFLLVNFYHHFTLRRPDHLALGKERARIVNGEIFYHNLFAAGNHKWKDSSYTLEFCALPINHKVLFSNDGKRNLLKAVIIVGHKAELFMGIGSSKFAFPDTDTQFNMIFTRLQNAVHAIGKILERIAVKAF